VTAQDLGKEGGIVERNFEAAVAAARWLDSVAVVVNGGLAWPNDPRDPTTVGPGIYRGNAGVILFYVELYHATGDRHWLEQAARGGRYVVENMLTEHGSAAVPFGLYDGLAGIGLACLELAKAGAGQEFTVAAHRCLLMIQTGSRHVGSGVEWPLRQSHASQGLNAEGAATDIIAGGAGIGLYLLRAGEELSVSTTELAVAAGRRLLDCSIRTPDGLDWSAGLSGIDYHMPNFSHGTAGVAYFLCSVGQVSGDTVFLDAARSGARHLQAIAFKENNVCLVPRRQSLYQEVNSDDDLPASSDYAFGWCHGPMGVGGTWYRLYQATSESEWLDWLVRSARAYLPGVVPDAIRGAKGPHESVCYCHGSAGNATFLLNVFLITGQDVFREAALRLLDTTVEQARHGGSTKRPELNWLQGQEHRASPTDEWSIEWAPQTGFSRGAAGIGYAFLAANALLSGRPPSVLLPDNPFGAHSRA
jgi:hypothetical protein